MTPDKPLVAMKLTIADWFTRMAFVSAPIAAFATLWEAS